MELLLVDRKVVGFAVIILENSFFFYLYANGGSLLGYFIYNQNLFLYGPNLVFKMLRLHKT